MKGSNKKLLFLEPAIMPNESDEEIVQRIASILRSKGFQIIEDRKNDENKDKNSKKENNNECREK